MKAMKKDHRNFKSKTTQTASGQAIVVRYRFPEKYKWLVTLCRAVVSTFYFRVVSRIIVPMLVPQ